MQKREHLREKQRKLEREHGAIVFDVLPPRTHQQSPREVDWTPIPHFKQVSADLNAPLHHLEQQTIQKDVVQHQEDHQGNLM